MNTRLAVVGGEVERRAGAAVQQHMPPVAAVRLNVAECVQIAQPQRVHVLHKRMSFTWASAEMRDSCAKYA